MKTALLLIAHGSREVQANEDLFYVGDALRGRAGFDFIQEAYLELAEPSIAEGGARCVAHGANRVVLLPYFLSAGIHVRQDLKRHRDELGARFPHVDFRLAEPLGRHASLVDIVAERIQAALGEREM